VSARTLRPGTSTWRLSSKARQARSRSSALPRSPTISTRQRIGRSGRAGGGGGGTGIGVGSATIGAEGVGSGSAAGASLALDG
jgi:hypothetical protein